MEKPIRESPPKNQDSQQLLQMKEENEKLKLIIANFQDQSQLKDEGYYRQQFLSLLEKIALALEKQASLFEESLESSESGESEGQKAEK